MKTKLNLPTLTDRKVETKLEKKKYIPGEVKEFARGFEEQFAELMLKEMNKAVGSSAGGTANNYYKSLMQKEQATRLTKNGGGLGIQDMILDDVYPERKRTKAHYQAYLDNKNRFRKNSDITMNQTKPSTKNISVKKQQAIQLVKPEKNHE